MGLNRLDNLVSDRVYRIQGVHRTLEYDGDLFPPDRVELRMVSPQASILETRDPEEVALLVRRLEAGRRLAEDASHLRIARGDPIRSVVDPPLECAAFLREVLSVCLRERMLECRELLSDRSRPYGVRVVCRLRHRIELRRARLP